VRTVDRAAHATIDHTHRFAVICPETGADGARIFVDRLADRLAAALTAKGAHDGSPLTRVACTFPGDEADLAGLRSQFAAFDRLEHPDHPVVQASE